MIYRCFINALSSIDVAFSSYRRFLRARLGRSVVSRLLGAGGNSDGNAYRRRMSDQSNPLGPPNPYELPPSRHACRGSFQSQEMQTELRPAHVITPSTPMTGLIFSQAFRGYPMGPHGRWGEGYPRVRPAEVK